MKVLQLVPALHYGDAIGNDVLSIRNHFRAMGAPSHVFTLEADPVMAVHARSWKSFAAEDDASALTILHYALPSPLNDCFRNARGTKILVYHNITPPAFLSTYPHLQHIAVEGRRQLERLVDCTDIAIGDSEFNRRELEQLGFRNTRTIPVFIDFEKFNVSGNEVLAEMFRDDFINFIFVGRLTPNKCQDDIIRLYGYFKRYVHERCRLFLVGRWQGFEKYYIQLMRLTSDLKLGDVYFTGGVILDELVTYYRLSDIFISMSEHEGFGVPLLEAMHFRIPVAAYHAAAVPFTLGGAGILFRDKARFRELSELLFYITSDDALRKAVIRRQDERLKSFGFSVIAEQWNRVAGLAPS